jgi:hypothetical protein
MDMRLRRLSIYKADNCRLHMYNDQYKSGGDEIHGWLHP